MNIYECDVLNIIKNSGFTNQRNLALQSGHSLGIVNKSLRNLISEGYLSSTYHCSPKANKLFAINKPQRAVILAAGYGMRMVPINLNIPKALLEVKGETLIERLIKQLHEVGIYEIYVIVGFMKEHFEYLIDDYNVKLIINTEYSIKNNLHSLHLAKDFLSNAYIIPSDLWFDKNPFRRDELYSWYMVSDYITNESPVKLNRKFELVTTPGSSNGNQMVGIAYLLEGDASIVKERLNLLCQDSRKNDCFWEETLYRDGRMIISAKVISASDYAEINTYEQLRELDFSSTHLHSDALDTITNVFHASTDEIKNITILKKGMTNRSFLFTCKNQKYIMRIPGEGTSQLINRREEFDVYHAIKGYGICDNILYINPETGYKITEFYETARVCNPFEESDIKECMSQLRKFHNLAITVPHTFDLYERIDFYERLRNDTASVYRDYTTTKSHVMSLRSFVEKHAKPHCLTHIDAVPDNFLFTEEGIKLIDWEYAGMQDPDVDIAMFCIYSLYDRLHVDMLIDSYYPEGCATEVRLKIYCYIAICGLLWSNWCEYKRLLGVEFGEYALCQYRYAKDYYKIVHDELTKNGGDTTCIL